VKLKKYFSPSFGWNDSLLSNLEVKNLNNAFYIAKNQELFLSKYCSIWKIYFSLSHARIS